MKKKVLLSSILTIALCLSLIAGSTYALFTSQSKVNVTATAGQVDVAATVDDTSVAYGSTLGDMLPQTSIEFAAETNTITLDKIVPGDYVSFDLKVTNNSNVNVKYRTVINVVEDDGLFAGLVATIDGEDYDGAYKASAWEMLEPGSAEKIIPVTITLPESAGNEYKGKTCTVSYIVEAVQGNGDVLNAADADELAAALENAVDGSVINLGAADFGTINLGGEDGIVDELTDITLVADANTVVEQIVIAAGAKITNLTIKDLDVDTPVSTSFADGLITIAAGATVENLVIEGSTFTRDMAANTPALSSSEPSATVTFKKCTFEGCRAYYSYSAECASLTFDNCTFQNYGDNWTIHTNAGNYDGDLTVTGCTFTGCHDGIMKLGNSGTVSDGYTLTFTDNTLTDCEGHGTVKTDANFFTVKVAEDAVVLSGNVKDNADWTPNSTYGFVVTVAEP